ncbi:MAG: transporter substrate-binding protein, partial [Paenibacillus sp.]|nr:transporter substrate-binding protein [Paenibacillus sp.]
MKAAVNRNFNGLKLGMVVVLSSGALLAACSKSESPAATENPSSAQSSPTTAKRGQITASIYDRGNIPAEEGTPIKNRWTDWLNQNGPTDV